MVLPKDVNFTGNMTEPHFSTGDNWNGVLCVVDAPEVVHLRVRDKRDTPQKCSHSRAIYLRVEVVSESGYTDPGCAVGDTPYGNVGREVQPKEEGVKLGNSSPK